MKFNYLIIIALVFGVKGALQSQNFYDSKSYNSFRKFETKDTVTNKNAVLILFDDNTFINYGVNTDSINSLWLTSGRWLHNQEIVMCRTYREISDPEKLFAQVKKQHAQRPGTLKITGKSRFHLVNYLDHVFNINKSGLTDKKSNLIYYEIKEGS